MIMSFLGIGKTQYKVHYKENNEDKVESFDDFNAARDRKQELIQKRIYCYIKKG